MHSLFDAWVGGAPDSLDASEVANRLQKLLREKLSESGIVPNLTSWRDNSQIFDELLVSENDLESFRGKLHALLRAVSMAEPIGKELDEFVGWLSDAGCSASITKAFPSVLLFFWNPERFIFIKPTAFDRFLSLIGEKELKQGTRLNAEMYDHVLDVANRLKPEIAELEPRDMIDLQSLYYRVASSEEGEKTGAGISYWIFQGNPSMFDVKKYIDGREEGTWTVSRYKDQIKPGDIGFIWMSGDRAGVYARFEVSSAPSADVKEDAPDLWAEDQDTFAVRCRFRFLDIYTRIPLLRGELTALPWGRDVSIVKNAQGSNFILTEEQYRQIKDILDERMER